MSIKRSTHSVTSIDAKKMYSSVKFEMIEWAVNLFLTNTSNDDKKTVKLCFDIVKFGMDNVFVTFEDQYYIYSGFLPVKEKGLAIGKFESVFFDDIVATYILENSQDFWRINL